MSWLVWIVVIAGAVATVAVVVWFVVGRTPERAANHEDRRASSGESGREAQPGDGVEGPAEPGAESQRPEGRGPLGPG